MTKDFAPKKKHASRMFSKSLQKSKRDQNGLNILNFMFFASVDVRKRSFETDCRAESDAEVLAFTQETSA